MTENMRIYEAGRAVPTEAQKSFNNGKFSGTDINPMWRIKKLTEIFGAAGIGWYVDNVTERAEQHGDVTMAIVNLDLHVKVNGEWSKPIYGTGGNILVRKGNASDEGYKMAYTDALSVACKALGIGADIYFEKDKTKYTEQNSKLDELEKKAEEVNSSNNAICECCGSALLPYTNDKGGKVTIRQHIDGCKTKFGGHVYCWPCIRDGRVSKGA